MRKREELENLVCRENTRKFYQKYKYLLQATTPDHNHVEPKE